MGFLDFVKEAGASLVGGGGPSDAERATALQNQVLGLGLEVDKLWIEVADDTVTVKGTAKSQADREKVVLAVGNTEGIARVDDQMEVSAADPEPEAKYHTVVSGDTLSKIAKEVYGNAMKYPVIFEANKPMLEDPDKIYPGQVLRIPAQD